jgi:protein dithiol oxidoreductase (disulfide-forming)
MKRRDFSLACGALAAAGAGVPAAVNAQGNAPVSGQDYLTLGKPVAVDAPAGKIELLEFFWYSCPHCNAFEPALEAWIKKAPADVLVKRVPVAFRDDFGPQQRLYYAIEAMGLIEKLHSKVFYAIHVERQRLDKPDSIGDWVAKQGVDKVKFMEQFNSFSVSSKASRAVQLQNAYKVEGVPALGIAGRFYTDGTLSKTMDRALLIAEYLMAEIRKGR